ncbi:MAG: hypothetical protein ACR2N3_19210 [Pyrinomonadaceae bacterium]
MRKNIRLWALFCLLIWIIASAAFVGITLTAGEGQDFDFLIKTVFWGYGLTCVLLMLVGVTGLYFMDKLKRVSLIGWRLFIFSFVVFSVILLPRIGNPLVVADEGWLSLYKHPLIWVLLALLAGNFILYFIKPKNNSNVQ